MYHRVCPVPRTLFPPTYNVRPEVFESQLRWLLNHGFEAWPLKRLIEAKKQGETISSRVFAVTFDDGYENNYTYALPILQKLQVPATIFLATAFIDSDAPFPFDNWVHSGDWQVRSEAWRPLNRSQCRKMLDSGLIEFGCHTHTHQDFRNHPTAMAADLEICRDYLHREFGIENPSFAFPYGTPDQGFSDAELADVAKQVGCSCALQVGNSVVHAKDDLFHWQRFDVASGDSGRSLAAKLDGWSQWVRGFWRSVRQTPPKRQTKALPSMSTLEPTLPQSQGWKSIRDRVVTHRSGMALLDQGIISGASFVTSLLVGRVLGKESLGILFVALAIFTFLQCITDQLVHVPYLVRSPHFDPDRNRKYMGSSFVHAMLATIIGLCVVMIISVSLQWNADASQVLPHILLLLAIALPGMMLREFMHSMFHNQLRQSEAVRLDSTVAITQISLLALLAYLGQLTLSNAIVVIGGAAAIIGLVNFPKLWRAMEISPPMVLQDLRSNWQIGRWTLGSYLIGSSAPTFLPWILVFFHGAGSTGLLAACLTLFGIAQTFLRGIGKYMAPQMAVSYARGGRAELILSIRRFLLFASLTITVIAIGLALGGELLVHFAFGDNYDGCAPIMHLLAISCWLQTFDVVAGNTLLALARSEQNFRADIARCITILAMAMWLIPSLGPLGVAWCLLVGMIAGLVVRAWLLVSALREIPASSNDQEWLTSVTP